VLPRAKALELADPERRDPPGQRVGGIVDVWSVTLPLTFLIVALSSLMDGCRDSSQLTELRLTPIGIAGCLPIMLHNAILRRAAGKRRSGTFVEMPAEC